MAPKREGEPLFRDKGYFKAPKIKAEGDSKVNLSAIPMMPSTRVKKEIKLESGGGSLSSIPWVSFAPSEGLKSDQKGHPRPKFHSGPPTVQVQMKGGQIVKAHYNAAEQRVYIKGELTGLKWGLESRSTELQVTTRLNDVGIRVEPKRPCSMFMGFRSRLRSFGLAFAVQEPQPKPEVTTQVPVVLMVKNETSGKKIVTKPTAAG
ncbi:hypothetical protein F4780DRAFT_776342 [Xylariomycetidae sp. FL0641]|nr:hypothetical protein F4780DRAFT_776342 [Xylariomycetidae sp. FL0641]